MSYDPTVVSYRDLLLVFFTIHDPTTLNRQGADVGTQYRSAIYYDSDSQRQVALAAIAEIEEQGVWSGKIVTEVAPLESFWEAEAYHKDYYLRNRNQPYCRIVIEPKGRKAAQRAPGAAVHLSGVAAVIRFRSRRGPRFSLWA